MFYNLQPKQNRTIYKRFLNAAAILGNLNSPKSVVPQISSRASEDIFCRVFNAKDLGRKDVSIDAYKPNDGIGIKTFQGPKMQKIAEFNNRKNTLSHQNHYRLHIQLLNIEIRDCLKLLMTYHWIECSITMFTEIRVKRFRYLNKRWQL